MKELAEKYQENNQIKLLDFKQFVDDYINIFSGSLKRLHELFEELNRFHPTIKLTMLQTLREGSQNWHKKDCGENSE